MHGYRSTSRGAIWAPPGGELAGSAGSWGMPEWGEWAGGTWLGEADAGVGLRPGCAVREIMGYNSPLQGKYWIGEYCNEFKHPVFLVSGWPIFVCGSVFCLFAGLFTKNTDPIFEVCFGEGPIFQDRVRIP